MKRSGFKSPGKGFKPRAEPMSRGTATLARTGSLKPSGKRLAAVGERGKRMRQGKVAPTAEEAAWMEAAQSFGCIVCFKMHAARCPAEIHHLKEGDRRMGHLFSIGLCYRHHRGGDGEGFFISRHPWKTRFEDAYGTESELLAQLRELVGQQRKEPA